MSERGAIFTVSHSNAYYFTNASNTDVLIYPETSNQQLLIGHRSNAPAYFALSNNCGQFAGDIVTRCNLTASNITTSNITVYTTATFKDIVFTGSIMSNGQPFTSSGGIAAGLSGNATFTNLSGSNVTLSNLTMSSITTTGVTGTSNLVLSSNAALTGTTTTQTLTATNAAGVSNINATNITSGTLATAYGGTGATVTTGTGSNVLNTSPTFAGTATFSNATITTTTTASNLTACNISACNLDAGVITARTFNADAIVITTVAAASYSNIQTSNITCSNIVATNDITCSNITIRSNITVYNPLQFRGFKVMPNMGSTPFNVTQQTIAIAGYSNSNNNTTLAIGSSGYLSVNNGTNDVLNVTGAGLITTSNVTASNMNVVKVLNTSNLTASNLTISNVSTTGVTGTGNLVLSSGPSFTNTLNNTGSIIAGKTVMYADSTNAYVLHSNILATYSTDYALYQGPTGDTVINTASGKSISFKQNNTDKMKIINSNVYFSDGGVNTMVSINRGFAQLGAVVSANAYCASGTTWTREKGTAGSVYFDLHNGSSSNDPPYFSFMGSLAGANSDESTISTFTEYMRISSSEINIPSTLKVTGKKTFTFNNPTRFTTSTTNWQYYDATSDPNIGISSDWSVQSTCFLATSDRRTKENIEDIKSNEYFDKLRPVVFDFKDKSIIRQYGLIAQEVEELYPSLISSSQDYIPEPYKLADKILNSSTLKLVNHGLKKGDKIKISIKDGENDDCPITETTVKDVFDIDVFVIDVEIKQGSSVFVISKQVDDFKRVNYTAIIPLLIKEIQDLKLKYQTDLDNLYAQIAEIKKSL